MNTIDALKKVVTDTQADIDADAERERRFTERRKEIDAAPAVALQQFWCPRCRRDFERMARKRVIMFCEPQRAVYEARCPRGHWCARRITDRANDPYWNESDLIRQERKRMEIDLLQPTDPRFRRIYGDPNAKMNAVREAEERKAHEARMRKGYGMW